MKQKLETFQLQKIERNYGYGIADYERGVRQLEAWRGDRELHEARRHARMVSETLAWAEETAERRLKATGLNRTKMVREVKKEIEKRNSKVEIEKARLKKEKRKAYRLAYLAKIGKTATEVRREYRERKRAESEQFNNLIGRCAGIAESPKQTGDNLLQEASC